MEGRWQRSGKVRGIHKPLPPIPSLAPSPSSPKDRLCKSQPSLSSCSAYNSVLLQRSIADSHPPDLRSPRSWTSSSLQPSSPPSFIAADHRASSEDLRSEEAAPSLRRDHPPPPLPPLPTSNSFEHFKHSNPHLDLTSSSSPPEYKNRAHTLHTHLGKYAQKEHDLSAYFGLEESKEEVEVETLLPRLSYSSLSLSPNSFSDSARLPLIQSALKMEWLWIAEEQQNIRQLRLRMTKLIDTWAEAMLETRRVSVTAARSKKAEISVKQIDEQNYARYALTTLFSWPRENLEMYAKMIKLIKRHPEYLSACLRNTPPDKLDLFITTITWSIFGDNTISIARRELLKLAELTMKEQWKEYQKAHPEKRANFLRLNTATTKLLNYFSTDTEEARKYLISILRQPICEVITYLEKSPNAHYLLDTNVSKIFYKLPEKEKGMFGKEPNFNTLADHIFMRPIIHDIAKDMVVLVHAFLKSIFEKLPAMPYEIRYLAKTLLSLADSEFSEGEKQILMSDLIFLRYINPSLVTPDFLAIIPDSSLSNPLRSCLANISKVILSIARGTSFKKGHGSSMQVLDEFCESIQINKFYDALVDVPPPHLSLVDGVNIYYGCTRSIVISQNEIITLHRLLANLPLHEMGSEKHIESMSHIISSLGDPPPLVDDKKDKFIILELKKREKDREDIYEESSEEESEQPSKLRQQSSSPHSSVKALMASRRKKQKLSKAAEGVSKALLLMESLQGYLKRPVSDILFSHLLCMDDQSSALKMILNELYSLDIDSLDSAQDNHHALLLSIETAFNNRIKDWEYRSEIFEEKRHLLLSINNLEHIIEDLSQTKETFVAYLNATKLRRFKEDYKSQIDKFLSNCKGMKTVESKRTTILQFLGAIKKAISSYPLWLNSPPNDVKFAWHDMERYLLLGIYSSVFEKEPEDVEMSKKMKEYRQLSASHPIFNISPRIRHWCFNPNNYSLPIQELEKINQVYTPQEKLTCIWNCCETLQNILCSLSFLFHHSN